MRIYRLENPAQRYAWGSASGITEALGIPNPGGGPLAEIWMGAHPSAPSTALVEGGRVGLDALIGRDPEAYLGETVVDRFGDSLPFLFKALSAGKPLSIQAHPSKRKARIGFERENLAGTPIDAPERNYRDPNHKPEMVVALTRFELICGFRPGGEIIEKLGDRILGRVSVDDIVDPYTGEVLVQANDEITEERVRIVEDAGIAKVKIRSVLTCESRRGICSLCYGRDLARGHMVNIGEAVGVIAAQSIGEPGTQLTMRTFHIGGVGQVRTEQSQLEARYDGVVRLENVEFVQREKHAIVMNRHGEIVFQVESWVERE